MDGKEAWQDECVSGRVLLLIRRARTLECGNSFEQDSILARLEERAELKYVIYVGCSWTKNRRIWKLILSRKVLG